MSLWVLKKPLVVEGGTMNAGGSFHSHTDVNLMSTVGKYRSRVSCVIFAIRFRHYFEWMPPVSQSIFYCITFRFGKMLFLTFSFFKANQYLLLKKTYHDFISKSTYHLTAHNTGFGGKNSSHKNHNRIFNYLATIHRLIHSHAWLPNWVWF